MTLYECLVITFEKVGGELRAVSHRKEIIDDHEGLGTYCPANGMVSIIPIREVEDGVKTENNPNL